MSSTDHRKWSSNDAWGIGILRGIIVAVSVTFSQHILDM